MRIVSREGWNAKPAKSVRHLDLNGPVTIHWNGGGTKWDRVADNEDARLNWMTRRLQAVQSFHMNGRGWSDIAYNYAVDPWGLVVWELRGLDVRPAAQGTAVGNNTSHALYVPTGVGDPDVTPACLSMVDDAIDYIAAVGNCDAMAVGHRDWKKTSCPGDFLYTSLSDLNAEPEEERALSDVVGMFDQAEGYGMVDSDGVVWMSDGAEHLGDLRDVSLNAPIVDAESSVSGNGYYLVSSDGGVFCFGDAEFKGSLGHLTLNEPIISIEVAPGGYWMAAADGGVFAFGVEFDGRPQIS